MVGDRYQFIEDPACYPGTTVLINFPGLRNQEALSSFENEQVARRSMDQPPDGDFNTTHYRALHRQLFQGVYDWAGNYRTVVTWKGQSRFAQPSFIPHLMEKAFEKLQAPPFLPGSEVDDFVLQAADFLGEVNHIHPFREGNGRTQLIFLRLLGQRAGHPFRIQNVEAEEFLHAMILSFHGRMDALIDELERILA
jgi:cell filamentation protein